MCATCRAVHGPWIHVMVFSDGQGWGQLMHHGFLNLECRQHRHVHESSHGYVHLCGYWSRRRHGWGCPQQVMLLAWRFVAAQVCSMEASERNQVLSFVNQLPQDIQLGVLWNKSWLTACTTQLRNVQGREKLVTYEIRIMPSQSAGLIHEWAQVHEKDWWPEGGWQLIYVLCKVWRAIVAGSSTLPALPSFIVHSWPGEQFGLILCFSCTVAASASRVMQVDIITSMVAPILFLSWKAGSLSLLWWIFGFFLSFKRHDFSGSPFCSFTSGPCHASEGGSFITTHVLLPKAKQNFFEGL